MSTKRPLGMDVLTAARRRIHQVYDDFDRISVSFSAGKDSGVLLNLVLDVAQERNRLPVDVLLVDLEAQYSLTMDFAKRMLSRPDVRAHWVCLPLHLRNSVSQFQPFWMCWDPSCPDKWVRPMPDHHSVISDEGFFPFFRRGMEFEEFVPEYGEWLAQGSQRTAILVGIRSDESINRFRTIRNEHKETWEGYPWTTRMADNVYNAYPIYDWRTEDIWTANGKLGYDYNKVYDLMYKAGLTLSQMRLCQPFGDDQRKGLWLYKLIEPDTWNKVVSRVEGANFGARYLAKQGRALGDRKTHLPEGHTWESFSKLLLRSMPPQHASHYIEKISTYFRWWAWYVGAREERSVVVSDADEYDEMGIYKNKGIPYEGYTGSGERGKKCGEGPAWRDPLWKRVCRVLLKNDWWGKGLGFSQNKREHERLQAVMLNRIHADI